MPACPSQKAENYLSAQCGVSKKKVPVDWCNTDSAEALALQSLPEAWLPGSATKKGSAQMEEQGEPFLQYVP